MICMYILSGNDALNDLFNQTEQIKQKSGQTKDMTRGLCPAVDHFQPTMIIILNI